MATLAQVRTIVDDWLTARWPLFTARQDAYFLAHGRYWQGIRWATLAATPSEGADGATTLTVKPTDQAEDWVDFGLGALLTAPCAFQCDVYDSPGGKGYVATVEVLYGGTLYTRSRNVGPETSRTVAWHVATP
jgi:hypothetical protein